MMLGEAGSIWAQRAQAELGTAQRFEELADQLDTLAIDPNLKVWVKDAQEDEYRHARLCAEMAIELGHPTGFSNPDNQGLVQCPWKNWPNSSEKILLDLIALCCLTESINASLLNTIYGDMPTSRPKALMREILRDEVKHGQIGWAALEHMKSRMDFGFVAQHLESMLDYVVNDSLFFSAGTGTENLGCEHGVLPEGLRREQFLATLEGIIIPGFEHFGIDVRPILRWRRQKISNVTASKTLDD